MSDIKCPVCNKGTVKEFETAPYFACSNEFCPSYSETDTTEYDILIRTRKALKIAVDLLKEIKDGKIPVSLGIYMDINDALDEITALTKGGDNE